MKLIVFSVIWTIFSLWYWMFVIFGSAALFQDGTPRGNMLTILALLLTLAIWAALTAVSIRFFGLHRSR